MKIGSRLSYNSLSVRSRGTSSLSRFRSWSPLSRRVWSWPRVTAAHRSDACIRTQTHTCHLQEHYAQQPLTLMTYVSARGLVCPLQEHTAYKQSLTLLTCDNVWGQGCVPLRPSYLADLQDSAIGTALGEADLLRRGLLSLMQDHGGTCTVNGRIFKW